MRYRNLDLEAFGYKKEDTLERFSVRVAHSPAGEQRLADAEAVALSPGLRSRLRRLEQRKLTLSEMIELGESLAVLFPPRARSLLDRSRASLDDDEGLRIRLKLDTYALADIPWEYIYLPGPDTPANTRGPDGFLVLDRRVSLARYEVQGQSPGTLDPVGKDTLRLVVLLANPIESGYPSLRLDLEQRNIEQALTGVNEIRAEFFSDATADTLQDALVRPAHIFHFAGHGEFSGDPGMALGSLEGEGSLILLDDNKRAAPFSAKKLALNLMGRGVRLAVLGACEGGRRDQVNPWTGVVPALTRAGIPAVVGMQYTIQDQNAIAFSRRFYRALAAGESIDGAVTDGRLSILNRSSDDERDWGVPVLYLRAEEGTLFPKAAGGSSSPAVPPQPERRSAPAPQSVSAATPPDANVDPRALRNAMVNAFGVEDLEVLCTDVQSDLKDAGIDLLVSLEIVGGNGLTMKVLNLIQYLDRRGYLGYLVTAVRRARPGII